MHSTAIVPRPSAPRIQAPQAQVAALTHGIDQIAARLAPAPLSMPRVRALLIDIAAVRQTMRGDADFAPLTQWSFPDGRGGVATVVEARDFGQAYLRALDARPDLAAFLRHPASVPVQDERGRALVAACQRQLAGAAGLAPGWAHAVQQVAAQHAVGGWLQTQITPGDGRLSPRGVVTALVALTHLANAHHDEAKPDHVLGRCLQTIARVAGGHDLAAIHRVAEQRSLALATRLFELRMRNCSEDEASSPGRWSVAWRTPGAAAAYAFGTREHLEAQLARHDLEDVLDAAQPEVALRSAIGDGILALGTGDLRLIPRTLPPAA